MTLDAAYYRCALLRIERWTLGLGGAGALAVTLRGTGRAGAGVAAGTVLAWINFRWLQQGVAVFERLSTQQAEAEKVRIPKRVYIKFFGRYALLLAVLCATFFYSLLPPAAVLAGLFTPAAGVVAEGVHQLTRGRRETG